jgi:RNA polymerase sigma factor (TIGR02999 family)
MLRSAHAGEPGAQDRLAERIYGDLRAMARRRLRGRGGEAGLTIQPTMLASDTLMKLLAQRQRFDNAGQLFAIASRMMMRLLIDYQRQRQAAKRGGSAVRVTLDPDRPAPQSPAQDDAEIDIEALDAALTRLANLDARKADVVRYRVLWGFTTAQTATQLGASVATIERDWAFARAWLAKELSASTTPPAGTVDR